MKHLLLFLACAVAAACAAAQSSGATRYPERPVTFVNPSSPGGGADVVSRILAQELTKSMGQSFVVENRPGAANMVATEIVAKARPDGYTLLIAATGTFVTNPLLYAKLRYSLEDFQPISILVDAPFVLSVHPSVRAANVNELVALAKQKPGELAFASFGNGSSSHLAGEFFQAVTGTRLLHVPYKGSAPGMADLLAGNVQMNFDSAVSATPQIQGGKIRPLGVAAAKRLPSLPNIPTLEEAGLKEFYAGTWYGVMAPAGTPPEIVRKLHAEIVRALAVPEVRTRLTELGTDIVGNTPEEFTAQIGRERARWAEVVRKSGIKPE